MVLFVKGTFAIKVSSWKRTDQSAGERGRQEEDGREDEP